MTVGAYDFEQIRGRLDDREAFGNMRNTPYFREAVYTGFSDEEYERRYASTRAKMERLDLDVLLAPGSQVSLGGGMLWLSGHLNWQSMVEYVVVPREGDPAFVYSMGGTHAEAIRRAIYPDDVRPSHMGHFGEALADAIAEMGYEDGRVGIAEADWRFNDFVPVNHVETIERRLPDVTIELVPGFFHELMFKKSPEEIEYVEKAGQLAVDALYAIRDRAEPGVTEYQLAAAAAHAAMDGGGLVDFLIIGSTPMDDPAQVFGNPRPSERELQAGDIIMNELGIGYQGYSAQIGIPVCVGEPTDRVRQFFDDIVLPGFELMREELKPGNEFAAIEAAGEFFRDHGYQSRPIHLHGIDLVSSSPHIGPGRVETYDYEREMQPGAVVMLEPNPISPDGMLGMFYGHTYVITDDGADRVTDCPHELVVAEW